MKKRLPVRVDPYRLAEQNTSLSGHLQTSGMNRLREVTQRIGDNLTAELEFFKRGSEHYLIGGTASLVSELSCQRCLRSFEYEINAEFELTMVETDFQAGQQMEAIDPLILSQGEALVLAEVLEDELLLAIPTVPLHANASDCRQNDAIGDGHADSEKVETYRPFEVLKGLKK